MKPERASREEKHCWTQGEDDGYTVEVFKVGFRDMQRSFKSISLL